MRSIDLPFPPPPPFCSCFDHKLFCTSLQCIRCLSAKSSFLGAHLRSCSYCEAFALPSESCAPLLIGQCWLCASGPWLRARSAKEAAKGLGLLHSDACVLLCLPARSIVLFCFILGLGMENIGGIFVVLICGLIVAIFMAMLEFLWSLRHSEQSEVGPENVPKGCLCLLLCVRCSAVLCSG